MADYTISVTFGALGMGGAMTPAAIRDALETLTSTNRLHATAIQGLPNAEDVLTISEIVTGLEALTGTNKLSATSLKNLAKTIVTGAEKALNYRAAGNVWSSSFQTASMSAIIQWDMFVASGINTSSNGHTIEDKDWCIALTSSPGFDFTDITKWYILKVSKIPTRDLAFRKNTDGLTASGIMPYDIAAYKSFALGLYSFATGYNCIANAAGSIATGDSSSASRVGGRAFASGRFAASGDAQFQENIMRLETTNASTTEIVLPSPMAIIGGKTYDFKIRLVARVNGGLQSKSWEWKVLASYTTTGSLSSIGTPIILSIPSTNALSAGITFSSSQLTILCTGLAATTVRWVAYIEAVEVYTSDGTGGTIAVDEGIVNNTYVQ